MIGSSSSNETKYVEVDSHDDSSEYTGDTMVPDDKNEDDKWKVSSILTSHPPLCLNDLTSFITAII